MLQAERKWLWGVLMALVLLLLLGAAPQAQAGELSFLVEPRLELEGAGMFADGLAAVKIDGKWGYMNAQGEIVIEPKYDLVNNFREGYAIVATGTENNYSVGVLHADGSYYPISFTSSDFADEQALQPSGCGFNNGYAFIPVLPHYGEGSGILVNPSGQRVLADYGILGPYTDGLIHSGWNVIGGNYQQYIDIQGRIMLEDDTTDFNSTEWRAFSAANFNDGLAAAYGYRNGDMGNGAMKWGFIDKSGKFVITPQYENFYVRGFYTGYEVFNEGIASVEDGNGNWGGIDKTGKTVIPFTQEDGFLFHEGYARVVSGGKYGFIDKSGALVIPAIYESADDGFYEGLAWVNSGGREGYINTAGELVIGLEYDSVYRFVDGVAFVRTLDGLYGIASNPLSDGSTVTTAAAPDADTPSSWAEEEIAAAAAAGLLTESTNQAYRSNISRYQFIDLVVNLVELATETELAAAPANTFRDTSDEAVLKGFAAGIVTGTSADTFSPNNQITREELATMLYRAISYIEDATGESVVRVSRSLSGYSDAGQVSDWATEAMGTLVANEIMSGTSATALSPKGQATVEQSCLLVYRLYLLLSAD